MEELYPYFERELTFIREMAPEFAARYPDAAAQLSLDRFDAADPHIERFIQAFALLAARVHYRLDADYPEFTQSLLEILYPHLLRPIPSTAIVQFTPGHDRPSEIVTIERGDGLVARSVSRESEATADGDAAAECHFRTCYPVSLWPLSVDHAAYTLPEWAVARRCGPGMLIRLRCDRGFAALSNASELGHPLRICLRGAGHVPYTIYELLLSEGTGIVARDPKQPARLVELPANAIRPVGFDADESLLPIERRVFDGFRLLQEYCACPDKFLFLDVDCLGAFARAGFGDTVEMFFPLGEAAAGLERRRPLRAAVGRDNFQLHCTPVVNLFERHLHLRLDHRQSEQLIDVDPRRPLHGEIYSVNAVSSIDPLTSQRLFYRPVHAHLVGDQPAPGGVLWRTSRRPSTRAGDSGSDVLLSFADTASQPTLPQDEGLRVAVTCTNRNLAAALLASGRTAQLVPSREGVDARFVRRPSPPARMNLTNRLDWRLISHLASSYMALAPDELMVASGGTGAESLRSMLALYHFGDDPVLKRQLEGIVGVSCATSTARIVRPKGHSGPPVVLGGYAVELAFADDAFRTSGHFVLASVLERFFGLAAAMNSFVQMTARTDGGRRFQWKPRAGAQLLR